LGANSGDARDGIVGQGRHGAHGPDGRRASQVAGTPDAWYRVRAVMRHRSARWGAALLISTARLAYPEPVPPLAPVSHPQTRAPPAPIGVLPKLTEAARRPELADLALYLDLRAAAANGDADRAASLARMLLDREPGTIWAGSARLEVGRVRRRTGDLNDALDWLDAPAHSL